MNPTEQKQAARAFVERWQAAEGNEQREANKFWIELCGEVLGVANPTHVLDFERKVRTRRIDVLWEDRGILIENKSRGVDMDLRYERGKLEGGEGRMVTPYEQAKWYADNLPRSARPRWVITCNFDEIRIYDMDEEFPERNGEVIRLEELPDQVHRLSFFTRAEESRIAREQELSMKAGQVVGKLYDALATRYLNLDDDPREQRSLNILITRLVFLLYCEDAGWLPEHLAFYKYLKTYEVQDMRRALIDLFDTLNTPVEERDPYLRDKLKVFPYVNGGLFAEQIIVPQLDEDARFTLLQEASVGFNWAEISPTIFGAVFESTLNPDTRRAGGMHYTSIENIHKVIDPLFLDDLKAELADIENEKTLRNRNLRLVRFQDKLSRLKFLDPACGSGIFLTETFLCLRKLENRVLENLNADAVLDLDVPGSTISVNVGQFYGIEVNDFAVEVARTALWIAEMQMKAKTLEVVDREVAPFPLRHAPNIACANALRLDWNDVLPAADCSYVMGNPPFYGGKMLSAEQRQDIRDLFGKVKLVNSIDYVSGWYVKACDYLSMNENIRAALVSTNSITQGEQVFPIWGTLLDRYPLHINFAWRTFVWDSEASDKAHVHVVIIGFSVGQEEPVKRLLDADGTIVTSRINPYLVDGPDVIVEAAAVPVSAELPCVYGSLCDPVVVATNLVSTVEGAGLWEFGILTSHFHNAWMRAVGGRLESRYRYAPKTVYNTYPWPSPTAERKTEVEQCAQAVLDARDAHPSRTLAELYDPAKMPADLRAAHTSLDAAVEAAYGVDFDGDEEKVVAHLFHLYAQLV